METTMRGMATAVENSLVRTSVCVRARARVYIKPVSYTHLDVYKRQPIYKARHSWCTLAMYTAVREYTVFSSIALCFPIGK